MSQANSSHTIKHIMCPPPRRRLSWEMLNEVNERLTELKHMAAITVEIGMELECEGEADTRFNIARDLGNRLAFCIVNVESRIDDLLEFIRDEPPVRLIKLLVALMALKLTRWRLQIVL
jgi:hypothetical protein